MVKKSKRKSKIYAGKTEEEWRDWGEKFGKRIDKVGKKIEKKGKEISIEVEDLAERVGKEIEKKGKKCEKKWKDWWFRTFGHIGPLLKVIFGFIWLVIGLWILNLINSNLASSFVSDISNFILTNIHWFFGASLFFAYNEYFSRKYPETFWVIRPITSGIGVVIVIWFLVWILNLINNYTENITIGLVSNFLYTNRWGIFVVFLVLGYGMVMIKKIFERFGED